MSRLRILRGCKIRFWRWVYSLILKSLLILNVKSSHTNGSVCLMAGECGHIFLSSQLGVPLGKPDWQDLGGTKNRQSLANSGEVGASIHIFPCLEC